ncbi:IclR family transcriptional regulator [Prosthecobacter fusiformis]|uniref:IclR family transcriptional regulator n=1 Tax=Prosthecobacter fusiformis TaxID=48464 RepID=A0A4R7RZ92_9BACT|nr:IclR family transcriptional regulator [Prosthecobacter fusiformis]TDU71232.1 IclR family transcriptional regulator [Prosthecobacter fusiformis]
MKYKKPTPDTPSLERYRVPILDRTLDLLELLVQEPGGLTLTAMTEKLKMPKNSVFRIATTLTLRGYAMRDVRTKSYRASRKLLSLGHAAMGGESLLQAAWPVLTALRDETGETALIGSLSGHQGVVLDQSVSLHPVKVVVEVGHAFPLHTAAPAKAMLAFLEKPACDLLIQQIRFQKKTPRTLTSARAFRAELSRVKTQGFALDQAEESESFTCAAAPVFDHHGQPVAALWISGPVDRLPIHSLAKYGCIVQRHADSLSQKLGWPGR